MYRVGPALSTEAWYARAAAQLPTVHDRNALMLALYMRMYIHTHTRTHTDMHARAKLWGELNLHKLILIVTVMNHHHTFSHVITHQHM